MTEKKRRPLFSVKTVTIKTNELSMRLLANNIYERLVSYADLSDCEDYRQYIIDEAIAPAIEEWAGFTQQEPEQAHRRGEE